MAKKTINISGTATQMVGDINDNFSDLYEGADAIVSVLPTKRVKVYDVMTRAYTGNGGGTIQVPCDITAGTKYVIEKSERGSNWQLEIVSIGGGDTTQELLRTTGGTTTVGGYDTEITALVDGTYFSIYSYGTGVINIYHYEDVSTLGASRWLGKKWLVIGDSISTEHVGLADVGYSELVAKSLVMQRENMAVSGSNTAHWLNPGSGGYVKKEWSSYSLDYDLVTLMLGSNDQGYNQVLGSISDEPDDSSYIGRLQLLYELLREKYPMSVIAFMTPIKRYDIEKGREGVNALGLTTEAYANAMKSVADYYSIPCLDLYNSINPLDATARATFFHDGDGLHPNDLGHAIFIAPRVEAFLRDIAPFYFNDWETLNNND